MMSRSTSMQNFKFLALKLIKLWEFLYSTLHLLHLWHWNIVANQLIWPTILYTIGSRNKFEEKLLATTLKQYNCKSLDLKRAAKLVVSKDFLKKRQNEDSFLLSTVPSTIRNYSQKILLFWNNSHMVFLQLIREHSYIM